MNTFVCLQAEVNINTSEQAWRSQHGLRPYIKDAQKILSRAHETGNPRITQQKIDFLHLPVSESNQRGPEHHIYIYHRPRIPDFPPPIDH